MISLSKPNKSQKYILGQLFPVLYLWKTVKVEEMYYFLTNHINSFMPYNLNYHFLVAISFAACCKHAICEEAFYLYLKYFV